jgi:hypothetical protein
MKRLLFLAMIIFCAAGFVYAKTSIKPITPDDLKDLKGAWTGERIGQQGGVERVDLILSNDSLPLEGKVTLHWEKRGIGSKTWPCKGHIENGRLILLWAKNRRKLDLGIHTGDGEMKLEGHITDRGFQGIVFLQKVQK